MMGSETASHSRVAENAQPTQDAGTKRICDDGFIRIVTHFHVCDTNNLFHKDSLLFFIARAFHPDKIPRIFLLNLGYKTENSMDVEN